MPRPIFVARVIWEGLILSQAAYTVEELAHIRHLENVAEIRRVPRGTAAQLIRANSHADFEEGLTDLLDEQYN